jgi:Flp pilus assembly protein TadG
MFDLTSHISKGLSRFRSNQSGAALVEFAILLPLMFATFALIVEGGRLFWSYQNAITGVRDATRYVARVAPTDLCSAAPSTTIASFQSEVSAALTSLSTSQVTVALDSLGLECVGAPGEYRVSPAPIAVVTAELTIIDLPFATLFALVGGTPSTQIQTTITDRSRVYGL